MSGSKQAHVHVCSLAAVTDTIVISEATALVSVLQSNLVPETPKTIAHDQHLKLAIDDIDMPFDGLQHANRDQVTQLCAFAQKWAAMPVEKNAMVIHCFAGVSRSTAAAFVVLCALNPNVPERDIAAKLRACSPSASPNRLIVAVADEVLGRNDRMSEAIQAMGPADSLGPTAAFSLPTALSIAQDGRIAASKAA